MKSKYSDLSNKKNVIFFSNSFGYGPTSTLIPVIKYFSKSFKNLNLIYAGPQFCWKLFSNELKNSITYCEINERNCDQIVNVIKENQVDYVISSLNRFSIKVASDLKIQSAMIDCLGWFWKDEELPLWFDRASIYFYNSFSQKKPVSLPNKAIKVPFIIDRHSKNVDFKKNNYTVLHLGGMKNPLTDTGFQFGYLNLVKTILEKTSLGDNKIVVLGGSESIEYLKNSIKNLNKNIFLKGACFDDFNKILKSSRSIITTSGMGGITNCLYLNRSINVFLSQNLSQLKLEKVLRENLLINSGLFWEDYFPDIKEEIENLSEKESINLIDQLSKNLSEDSEKLQMLINNFEKIVNLDNKTNIKTEFEFDGEEFISKYLQSSWSLT